MTIQGEAYQITQFIKQEVEWAKSEQDLRGRFEGNMAATIVLVKKGFA